MQPPWNSLRRFLSLPTRSRTIVRPRPRTRPNLEHLEDRTVPTIVFNSALGGDTIQWMSGQVVTSPVSNSTALQNPTVYFIFQGKSWNSTNAGALAADAQTIIQSKYLSKLTDYGSTGTAVYGGYTIDNTAAPTPDPNPNNQENQFKGTAQTEINKIVPQMSSWTKPKDKDATDSPVYIVVYDTGFTDGNGNHQGGEGWNGSMEYNNNSNLTMNEIFIADWAGDQDGFTNTFSHEIVERIFTGSGTGLTMYAKADAGTDNGEFLNAQIADNEPDHANYTYRLDGSLQVQAYWSLSSPNSNGLDGGFGAFVVPDGNEENFFLDPQWNFVKYETINNQIYPLYSYTKNNQLMIVGDNQGNTITLGTTSNGGVQVSQNGDTASFDSYYEPSLHITDVIVQPGGGSSAVNVLATPSNIPTYIEDQGNDTVVIGNTNGNVDNGAGYLGSIQGLVAVAANGDIGEPGSTVLFVDDSGDSVGQTVNMEDGQIDYGSAAPIYYNPSASPTGDVTELLVYGGKGGNTFNVQKTSQLYSGNWINTGTGNDTVNVSATQGWLEVNNPGGDDALNVGVGNTSSLNGTVYAWGAGSTRLNIDDSSDSTGRTVTMNDGTIFGLGSGGIYGTPTSSATGGVTEVDVEGGSGGNTFNVNNTSKLYRSTHLTTGAGNDTVNVGNGNSLKGILGAVSVNGGSGSNTLNANDSGSASGQLYTLSSTQLKRTGIAAITYASLAAVHVTASGNDTLTLLTPVPTVAATFNGGTGTNTLQGANVSNSWTISGANSGKLDSVSFSNFQKLVGGTGVDVFNFSSTSGTGLSINGGAAPAHQGNWLDYAAFPSTSAVTVNLATGSAANVNSGAAGAVTNIQNVIGSSSGTNNLTGTSQGNILIGGSGANTLTGGSGGSLLIGGSGHGAITGGSGSDILIAGTTTYNAATTAGQDALMAILAELQSADTFALKVSDLINGNKTAGGSDLNGSNKLTWGVSGATVTPSLGAFTLAGDAAASAAADWFFANAPSTVKDFNDDSVKDEHNNNAIGVF